MSCNNIRIVVACTELTRQVLMKEYCHQVKDRDTLFQKELNVDVVSFNARQKIGENKRRTCSVKIYLNTAHSKKYKPGKTEAAFSDAIEKRANELINSRMLGAFEATGSVSKATNNVLDSLAVIETSYQKESIRKMFYRYRIVRDII